MLPSFIDLLCGIVTYAIVMQLYEYGNRTRTTAIPYRITSAIISIILIFFLLDYGSHFFILTYRFYTTAEEMNAYAWYRYIIVTGILFKAHEFLDEKMRATEMSNFIFASIRFNGYFRETDVDTRQRIADHSMRTAYQEQTGRPFHEDLLATSFGEQPTRFKKVSLDELKEKKKSRPPEYQEQIASLKQNRRTDVSVAFRFQLMDSGSHPFLKWMEHFVIDPQLKELSFRIITPLERTVPCTTHAEQSRLIERTYEALHLLIAFDWFHLYASYIGSISVCFCNNVFSEKMTEEEIPLMQMTISVNSLRQRADRITTISEIRSITSIQFFQS